jgi:hypothetical protein
MYDELERYKRNNEQQKIRRESVAENQEAEWHILKSEAQNLDKQSVAGEQFQWVEDEQSPALVLGNVAVFFEKRRKMVTVNGVLTTEFEYQVRFDRRPMRSGQLWVDPENRLQVLRWGLTLVPHDEHVACWLIQLGPPSLTTEAVVGKIAVRLAERSVEYKKEYDWAS